MVSTESLGVVQKYLQVLGVEPEATLVYLELNKLGPSSVLQLAQATGISRTQMYRQLDELQSKGLVTSEQLHYGTLFRALEFERINALIASREAETEGLKRNLGPVTELMEQLSGSAGPKASVRQYHGAAGLKEVAWNLTKADGEFRALVAPQTKQYLDKAFARRCRERFDEQSLTTYRLTNAGKINALDLEPFDPERTYVRSIEPAVLEITFEVYIYNNTVTVLECSPARQTALELQHPAMHLMVRQLFDGLWAQATPLNIGR